MHLVVAPGLAVDVVSFSFLAAGFWEGTANVHPIRDDVTSLMADLGICVKRETSSFPK